MSSTQPPHHQRQHQQHSNQPSTHQLHTYGAGSSSSSSHTINKTAQTGPLGHLQLFADERRDAIALPKIETENHSPHSSPYTSPHLAPRARLGAVGNMEEVTLPPIQAAVPMRRGAVSGASSGPSLPFPPIRLSYEEDIPSRGPSPTLGKRGSFSMGHSNHVPPGPDIQLPTPVLSGSGERRPGLVTTPSYVAGQSLYHGDGSSSDVPRSGGVRLMDENHGHYSNPTRPNLPWTQYKSNLARSESVEVGPPPFHPYHSSPPMATSSLSAQRAIGQQQEFNDDYQRQHPHTRLPHHLQHHPYSDRSSSGGGGGGGGHRYDYHREESIMSPASNHSILQGDPALSPRTSQNHLLQDDSHGHGDIDSIMNGKRPRSAPRVMSSQPRIFACTQCPARFARNHDLKRHQRGHLSVRPYPCNWCGKSFSRKDALKRHILVKGCGKNGKGGGGGGKGEGKGRRNRGEGDDKRAHQADSSGEQDDGQYGEEDEQDDGGSEENQDGGNDHAFAFHHQRWEPKGTSSQDHGQDDRQSSSIDPYFSTKEEYRSNYKDTVIQIATSSFSNTGLHSTNMSLPYRRPSASVA